MSQLATHHLSDAKSDLKKDFVMSECKKCVLTIAQDKNCFSKIEIRE